MDRETDRPTTGNGNREDFFTYAATEERSREVRKPTLLLAIQLLTVFAFAILLLVACIAGIVLIWRGVF